MTPAMLLSAPAAVGLPAPRARAALAAMLRPTATAWPRTRAARRTRGACTAAAPCVASLDGGYRAGAASLGASLYTPTPAAGNGNGAASTATEEELAPWQRKTKIVCTIGPVTAGRDALFALADAGMNVARLNFSHGEFAWHAGIIALVKEYNAMGKGPVAIMLDTKGPEVRSGDLAEPVQLAVGDTWTFTTQLGVRGENRSVSVNYEAFTADVAPGDTLLVDGGLLSFRVTAVEGRDVVCRCVEGGELASRRHLNVRGKSASLPSITAKDWEDIAFGVEHGVDYFALSFVNSADVVVQLKAYIASKNAHAKVLAKIESAASVANLSEILGAADGAMVARGDLGAELPVEEVPWLQEEIIRQCREMGKPVIVATNMLESMIQNAIPTRAEVSDIAIAVREGSDAVMLSGETAYGAHPMKALAVMATVSARTERAMAFAGRDPLAGLARILAPPDATIVASTGMSVDGRPMTPEERAEWDASALMALHAAGIARAKGTPILLFTRTGNMAALLAQQRPTRPTFAVTNNDNVLRRLALYHGIVPIKMEFGTSAEETFARAMALIKARGLMRTGEEVVLLQSGKQPIWRSERTHIIQVRPLP